MEEMKFHNMKVSINVTIDEETSTRALQLSYPDELRHADMLDRIIAQIRYEMSEFVDKLDKKNRYRPSQIEQMIEDITRLKSVDTSSDK